MKKELYLRVFADIITAGVSWIMFFYYRKTTIEVIPFEFSITLITGTISVVLLWITIYTLSENYIDIRKISRLNELSRTIIQTLIGVLIIFFFLIIDDIDNYRSYKYYYHAIISITLIHFTITFLVRLLLANSMVKKIQAQAFGFRTIIIGDTREIKKTIKKLRRSGNIIIGYIDPKQSNEKLNIPNLGSLDHLHQTIKINKIEETILAFNKSQFKKYHSIINDLLYEEITIKVPPKTTDLLSGKVKMKSLLDLSFIEIKPIKMSLIESIIKRVADILLSIIALIILSPLLIITSLLVKTSSQGPIFYKQERLGHKAKVFDIIKFRSMYINAEKNTPLLSSDNDNRITFWGKIMRKYRIDELPQFYNVLIGEMSIIGPRPERDFFAKKILKKAPHYKLVHKVKPGITSWGMVKFGYAENTDEMISRLDYDIIYLENLSLFSDFKVFVLTIFIILQGRGK